MKTQIKLVPFALTLIMVLLLLPMTQVPAWAGYGFAGGTGTLEDPYRIGTVEHLKNVRYHCDSHFVLTNNITLEEEFWLPIGSGAKPFNGTFDGNWHTISDLTITARGDGNFGFFGSIGSGAKIRNLQLVGINIDVITPYGTSYAGGLAGEVTGGSIENCGVWGLLSGTNVGGLAGNVKGSSINQCFADVNVMTNSTGNYFGGGLVGLLGGGESRITNSCAFGSVSAYWAGGLVGVLNDQASVIHSYATGSVNRGNAGGGLIGMKVGSDGQVIDSYYDKDTTGQVYSYGGTGKTTEEMQTTTPFEGWNADIWHFESGKYPALYYQREQYNITYDLNTGTGITPVDPSMYRGFDSVTTLSANDLTPPVGKAFKEWNTKSDGSGFGYTSGSTVGMRDKNITVYAIWDTLHTVSYDLNTGTGAAPSSEQHFGGDIFMAASGSEMTAPAGKRFLEWNTTESGDGTAYKSGDSVIMPALNLTLYATWEAIQDGSEEFPFLVNDYQDLYCLKDGLGFHYLQTADIKLPDPYSDYEELDDLPGYSNWAPLGYKWNPHTESYDSYPFEGSYDGGGFTISNLVIDTDAFRYAGLFGYVATGAELKNTSLVDVQIAFSFSHGKYPGCVGALAGFNEGTITACTANGYLSGGSNSTGGGIAGYNKGTITACTAKGYLSGGSDSYVGGIAGINDTDGLIQNSTASGCLAGGKNSFVEGIAGLNVGAINSCTDNTTRAHAETLFFVEEDKKFYIGEPKDEIEASKLAGWSYDSDTGILTFDNLDWVTLSPRALVIIPGSNNNLTIQLEPGSKNSFISLFSGNGIYSCGLEVIGNLTINGTGTLTVQSGISKYDFVDGIYVQGDLLINGGTIKATADNALIDGSESTGIYAEGGVTVSGGTVTAAGSTQAIMTWNGDAVIVNIAEGYRYLTNESPSPVGAVGPINSSVSPFINSEAYKYIHILPGLEKENEYTRTSPTSSGYTAEVSSGGSVPVTVNTTAGSASLNLGSLSKWLEDGKDTIVTLPIIPGIIRYTAYIPAASLKNNASVSLTLNTEIGKVTVPGNMLLVTGFMGNAGIAISPVDKSNLPLSVQSNIGNRPIISINLTIDGRPIEWSNLDAPATISIPYTPTAEELSNPECIIIRYIDSIGNVVTIPNGYYDPQASAVTFSTTHFSKYAVSYNPVSFSDVNSEAWYKKAVGFIAARDITSGTGNDKYSPNAKLTRGEFIVMLMRAYGLSNDISLGDNFSDAGNTYYTDYLKAAKTLGISKGVGNNLFAPDKEITRQEMLTLINNALKIINQLPQSDSSKTLSDFADAYKIDAWAKPSFTLMVQAGVVKGNKGTLRPLDTTTRAEIAQVFYNMLGK